MPEIQQSTRCPFCEGFETRVVLVEPRQVGNRCTSCNAKTEAPVEPVDGLDLDHVTKYS
jgi:hypothetical protein